MPQHCVEHENRSDRLTQAESCLKNLKFNWDEGRRHMQKREEIVEKELRTKLNASTFYKILSILITVLTILIGANWSLMFNIDSKVNNIDKKQAVVISQLEHIKNEQTQ